jgi:hypothetical protein
VGDARRPATLLHRRPPQSARLEAALQLAHPSVDDEFGADEVAAVRREEENGPRDLLGLATLSGRDTFRWTLAALLARILVLPVIGWLMLFGQPPFSNGVPRDVRTRLRQ